MEQVPPRGFGFGLVRKWVWYPPFIKKNKKNLLHLSSKKIKNKKFQGGVVGVYIFLDLCNLLGLGGV